MSTEQSGPNWTKARTDHPTLLQSDDPNNVILIGTYLGQLNVMPFTN